MIAAHAVRAVLWDLDGTLVDSGDQHWRAWRETMCAEGVELTYQQFLDSFGQKERPDFERLVRRSGLA